MKKQIAGCVLAGGKNRRFKGEKKIYLSYQNNAFGEHIIEEISFLDRVYLSVESKEPYEIIKRDIKENRDIDIDSITDSIPEIGPMGGIYSVLKVCEEEALLVIPCDMIPFPRDIVDCIVKQYCNSGKPVLLEIGGRAMPIPSIYTKTMIPEMERSIKNKEYRLSRIWEGLKCDFEIYKADSYKNLPNINTKKDYIKLIEEQLDLDSYKHNIISKEGIK